MQIRRALCVQGFNKGLHTEAVLMYIMRGFNSCKTRNDTQACSAFPLLFAVATIAMSRGQHFLAPRDIKDHEPLFKLDVDPQRDDDASPTSS